MGLHEGLTLGTCFLLQLSFCKNLQVHSWDMSTWKVGIRLLLL